MSSTGHVLCRLQQNSADICSLGKHLKEKSGTLGDPSFIVKQEGQPQESEAIPISSDTIESMICHGTFRMKINFAIRDRLQKTTIYLRMSRNQVDTIPISRFPRLIFEEDTSKSSKQVFERTNNRKHPLTPYS